MAFSIITNNEQKSLATKSYSSPDPHFFQMSFSQILSYHLWDSWKQIICVAADS